MTGKKSVRRNERRTKRKLQEARRKRQNYIVLGLLAVTLVYFGLQSAPPAEPLASNQVISAGADVYIETCASCHGENGEGHAALITAPALDGSEHSWHHSDGQIQALILDGGVEMPAFSDELTGDEIVAVIRFLQTRWSADQLASQQRVSETSPLQ